MDFTNIFLITLIVLAVMVFMPEILGLGLIAVLIAGVIYFAKYLLIGLGIVLGAVLVGATIKVCKK